MKSTQNALTSLIKVAACAILTLGAVAQAQDKKADPTGTWTWSQPGRNGGPSRKYTRNVKLVGDEGAAPVFAPGRGGETGGWAVPDGTRQAQEASAEGGRD